MRALIRVLAIIFFLAVIAKAMSGQTTAPLYTTGIPAVDMRIMLFEMGCTRIMEVEVDSVTYNEFWVNPTQSIHFCEIPPTTISTVERYGQIVTVDYTFEKKKLSDLRNCLITLGAERVPTDEDVSEFGLVIWEEYVSDQTFLIYSYDNEAYHIAVMALEQQ